MDSVEYERKCNPTPDQQRYGPYLLRRAALNHPAWLLIVIFVAYAVLWARLGLDTKDGGFMLGNAWRILHGEVPYRDIIYNKPPIPIYLRTVPLLFGNFAVYADRIICLGEFAAIAIAGSSILLRALGRNDDRVLFWTFAAGAFVMSVHNFPMIGWYTVDGVLFSTLALLALTRKHIAVAGTVAAAALMCKQNFAAVTLLLGLMAAVIGPKAALRYILGVGVLLGGIATLLVFQGALQPMLELTLGVGTGGDILDSAVIAYAKELESPDAALAFIAALLTLLIRPDASGTARADAYTAAVITILAAFAVYVLTVMRLNYAASIHIFAGAGVLLILSAVWTVCWILSQRDMFRRNPRQSLVEALLPIVGLFGIAWAASISFGYMTPAFFAVPLLAPLVLNPLPSLAAVMRLKLVIASAVFAFGVALANPYGEGARIGQLVSVPGFAHGAALIRTSAKTSAKLQDLAAIISRNPNRAIAVLPIFSSFEMFFNRKSPSPVAWSADVDFSPANRSAYTKIILNRICRAHALVAVEKDLAAFTHLPNNKLDRSRVLDYIEKTWTRNRETTYFALYEPPQAC